MRPRSAGDCGRYYSSAGTRRTAQGTTSNHNHKTTDFITMKIETKKAKNNEPRSNRNGFKKRVRTYLPGEGPPLPKAGRVPIVEMILHWDNNQAVIRTLLDTGSTIPLLSTTWAELLPVPVAGRSEAQRVNDFAGEAVDGAGKYYTFPMTLQCRKHYSIESFEIAPLAGEYDAILMYW